MVAACDRGLRFFRCPTEKEIPCFARYSFLVTGLSVSTSLVEAPQADLPLHKVASLKITILSTMLADRGMGEWGFSALVEADGHRILFDTGLHPETVLHNARELGIDLSTVTDVVLSHHHGDHTGGLLALRRELSKASPSGDCPGFMWRQESS